MPYEWDNVWEQVNKDEDEENTACYSPDTLTSMANLASTYRNQGRCTEEQELRDQRSLVNLSTEVSKYLPPPVRERL